MSDTADRSYSFLRCREVDAGDKHARSWPNEWRRPSDPAVRPPHPSTGDRSANQNRPREVGGP